jgi:hypothetical protein
VEANHKPAETADLRAVRAAATALGMTGEPAMVKAYACPEVSTTTLRAVANVELKTVPGNARAYAVGTNGPNGTHAWEKESARPD